MHGDYMNDVFQFLIWVGGSALGLIALGVLIGWMIWG